MSFSTAETRTPSSNSLVIILCWKLRPHFEDRARRIAEFMGAESSIIEVSTASDIKSIEQDLVTSVAVILHASELVKIIEALGRGIDEVFGLLDSAAHVFIYGFESTDQHSTMIRSLSSGSLLGLESLPDKDVGFHVSSATPEWCRQFSGLVVKGSDPTRDACFVEGTPRDIQTLIHTAGKPFFSRINRGASKLFLLACGDLANLDEKVSRDADLLPWFSRLVPLMIFLRVALGDRIWHSGCSQACLIIDDPLLKRSYGFLEFSKLLEMMNQLQFSTSIAFIPWNHRRSRKEIAERVSAGVSSLSLCVHGCDHTGAEFAITDSQLLHGKAQLALDRMQAHSRRHGIPFDDVMVFPQGLFSAEALEALEACGYLAAVNTDPCPSSTPPSLTLGQLLDVAVSTATPFPLFVRHYPTDAALFAFDLFLGKPAFVVEHHGYFKNGYEQLRTLVKQLKQLDDQLEWQDPATVCSQANLKKKMLNGDIHVRFYTNRFRLANRQSVTQTYVLLRKWPSSRPLPAATVQGRELMIERDNDKIAITVSLKAGEAVDVRIDSGSGTATSFVWNPTFKHSARSFVRRALSELRDNHIETNQFLKNLVMGAMKLRNAKPAASQLTLDAARMKPRSGSPVEKVS